MTTSFGYLLPTREITMTSDRPDPAVILDLAAAAEQAGFDSLWVGDSLHARPRLEALTTLAAVAARTSRATLGTAVLLPVIRHPAVLANEIASLDLIAGGRLVLGMGVSTKNDAVAREFAAAGVPHAERAARFDEVIEVMRRLWREPEVNHAGRFYSLSGVRAGLRPRQVDGPPIWLAGGVEGALRRVARLADGWMPNPPDPVVFAANSARLSVLAREAGRDPAAIHRAVYTTVNVNPDVGQAEREITDFIERYYGSAYGEQKKRQSLCSGNALQVADWLRAFIDAGAATVIVRFGGPDQHGQMARFTGDVLPRLRG